MKLIQEFMAGFRDGCRPFVRVMPSYLRTIALSILMVLAGVGTIAIRTTMTEPFAVVMQVLGEGLLIGGALLGAIACLRAWWELFRKCRRT